MPSPLVQATNFANGSTSFAGQTFSSPTTAGNLLVAFVTATSSTSVTTAPSGWTIAVTDTSLPVSATILYRANAPSITSLTVTLGGTATWTMSLAEYSGPTTSPLDQIGSDSSGGTSGSVTTTSPNEIVIALLTKNAGQLFSSPTNGFTNEKAIDLMGSSCSAVWLDKVVSSTGTYSTSFGGGSPQGGVIASFQLPGTGSAFSGSGSASGTFVGSSLASSTATGTASASGTFVGASLAASTFGGAGGASGAFQTGSRFQGFCEASGSFATGVAISSTFTASGDGASVFVGVASTSGVPPDPTFVGHGSTSGTFVGASVASSTFSATGTTTGTVFSVSSATPYRTNQVGCPCTCGPPCMGSPTSITPQYVDPCEPSGLMPSVTFTVRDNTGTVIGTGTSDATGFCDPPIEVFAPIAAFGSVSVSSLPCWVNPIADYPSLFHSGCGGSVFVPPFTGTLKSGYNCCCDSLTIVPTRRCAPMPSSLTATVNGETCTLTEVVSGGGLYQGCYTHECTIVDVIQVPAPPSGFMTEYSTPYTGAMPVAVGYTCGSASIGFCYRGGSCDGMGGFDNTWAGISGSCPSPCFHGVSTVFNIQCLWGGIGDLVGGPLSCTPIFWSGSVTSPVSDCIDALPGRNCIGLCEDGACDSDIFNVLWGTATLTITVSE